MSAGMPWNDERNTNRLDRRIQDCVNAASSFHYPANWMHGIGITSEIAISLSQPRPSHTSSISIYSRSGLFLTKLQGSSADLRSQGSCGPPVPNPIIEFEGRPRRPQKVAEGCMFTIRSKSNLPKPHEAHPKHSSTTRFLRWVSTSSHFAGLLTYFWNEDEGIWGRET